MGFFYFDESNHDNRDILGFCLGAFVYADRDPGPEVSQKLIERGLLPGLDEFKSSSFMSRNPTQAELREDLYSILAHCCRVGVLVVPRSTELGFSAICLLKKMIRHPDLSQMPHTVYFDQGIFRAASSATPLVHDPDLTERCTLHLEQDSRLVPGIQLADLAAHACATMLRESLGAVKKTVQAGDNSGYDPIEIGFALWARLRYSLLFSDPHLEESYYRMLWIG